MSTRMIAISGPPGAGKSTLARALAEKLGWQLVAFDDHEQMTRRGVGEIHNWLGRGAPYSEIPVPGLEQALDAALARGPVVFDTPLGRADIRTSDLIDLSVWLDVPADVALARKISQFASQVPTGQEAGFVGWLKGYLAAHQEIVRPAIAHQLSRVRPAADVILDSTEENPTQFAQIFEKIDI